MSKTVLSVALLPLRTTHTTHDSLVSDEHELTVTELPRFSTTAPGAVPVYFRGAAVIAFVLGLTPRLVRLAAVPLLTSLKRMPVFSLFPMAMFANALCRHIILISQSRAPRLSYELNTLARVYAYPNFHSLSTGEVSDPSMPTSDKIEWRMATGMGVVAGVTSYYLEQIWFIYPGFSFLLPAGISLFEALTATTAPDWLQSLIEVLAYTFIGIEILREPAKMLTANPAIYPMDNAIDALRQGVSDPYPLFNRALRQLLPQSAMDLFAPAENSAVLASPGYYCTRALASFIAILPLFLGMAIASIIVPPRYFTLLSGYDSQEQAPSPSTMYAAESLLLFSLLSLVLQICAAPQPGTRQSIVGECFSALSTPLAYISQGVNRGIDCVVERLLPPVATASLGRSQMSLYGTLPASSPQDLLDSQRIEIVL